MVYQLPSRGTVFLTIKAEGGTHMYCLAECLAQKWLGTQKHILYWDLFLKFVVKELVLGERVMQN